jgi:PIN domain nuclease of toxin-antitoxin system
MKYLLDSHAIFWLVDKNPKLSATALEIIGDIHKEVFASTISFWELSLKMGLGKFSVDLPEFEELEEILIEDFHIGIIGLNEKESLSFYRLPMPPEHRDPFDRMLVWQAIRRNMTLISCDPALEWYKHHGLSIVW